MGISILGSVVTNVNTSASSISVSHTLSAGSNRIIVVFIGSLQGSYRGFTSSVTYGGVTMHQINANGAHVSSYVYGESFYLLENELPANGSITVTATYAGATSTNRLSVYCLQDVMQSRPQTQGNYTSNDSSTTTIDISTLSSGAWVLGGAWSNSISTFTYGAGQTELFDLNGDSLTFCGSYQEMNPAGLSGTTFTATNSGMFIALAFSVSPSSIPNTIYVLGAPASNRETGATCTTTHTLIAGNKRAIIAIATSFQDTTYVWPATGCTYGGIAMNLLASDIKYYNGTNDYVSINIYYLLESSLPSNGDKTVTMTYPNSVYGQLSVIEIANVKQDTIPLYGTYSSVASNQSSVSITLPNKNWALISGALNGNASVTHTEGTGQLEFFDSPDSKTSYANTFRIFSETGSATETFTSTVGSMMIAGTIAFAPQINPAGNGIGISPYLVF